MAKILVVDDEAHVRDVLRQMLEQSGHRVREAGDGDEGFRQWTQWAPDLVITDILMPNKGGLVLIKELRERDPGARVIATSGGGRTGRLNFLSTATTFPGVRSLPKPFSRDALLTLVDEVLAAQDGRSA